VTKKLTRKRTLGAILRAARTKADLSLETAEKETKICGKYLVALEGGDYTALPAEAYNVGFVRTYAQFLKLNQEKILQLYRDERSNTRLQSSNHHVTLAPKRLGDWQFLITPKLIGIMTTMAVFGGMVSYIFVQFNKFSEPPVIELKGPQEFTSDKDTVALSGKTTAGAIVSMNTQPISVAPDGTFTQDVQLAPGVNEVVIRSKNRAQKESQVAVKVLYDQGVANLPTSVTKE